MIDPLAHLIPVIAVVGTWDSAVLRSAEFTRSLLVSGLAILAGLLPITLESESLSAIES